MVSAEAQPNENSAVKTDGGSVNFAFTDPSNTRVVGFIAIAQIEDSDEVVVNYVFDDGPVAGGSGQGGNCKMVAEFNEFVTIDEELNTGKIDLDTSDFIDCDRKVGDDAIISLTLTGDEDSKPVKTKFSDRYCGLPDESGEEICNKIHGSRIALSGIAEGSFGVLSMTLDGHMGTEKAIITHSNKGTE